MRGLAAALLVVLGGCCRSPRPAAPVPASAPASLPAPVALGPLTPRVVPGEGITWAVTFLGLEGGRARFAAGVPGVEDGRAVVLVRAEAESAGLIAMVRPIYDEATTVLDVASGLPLRTDGGTNVSGKDVAVAARRSGDGSVQLVIRREGGAPSERTQRLPVVDTHDAVSAIYLLRAWRAPTGTRASFYTLGGTRVWLTVVTIVGAGEIVVPLGRFRAIRLDGESARLAGDGSVDKTRAGRHFSVWLSDDEDRVPLKISAETEYGEIDVVATSRVVPP